MIHRGVAGGVLIILCGMLGGCQGGGGVFDVRSFGARGDGTTLDTAAVNRTIDAAANAGGGTVRFVAGTYLCYSIHLQSNIALDVENGATILAAGTPEAGDYDPPEPNPSNRYQDFGHTHWHNSLIWGEGLSNVSIIGGGRIWGRGLSIGHRKSATRPSDWTPHDAWNTPESPTAEATTQPAPPDVPYDETADNVADIAATRPVTRPTNEIPYPNQRDTLPSGIGNKAIALKNCYHVTIRDVSIFEGGHFAILATAVDGLTIDNVKIDTNRDGIDVDCCRDAHISNTSVNSPWDDAIVLKASYCLGYLRDTENVTITNCMVSGGYQEGTLLDGSFKRIGKDYNGGHRVGRTGRLKIGTETNGGFKNIVISNCLLDNCQGLAIESVDGGVIEDVSISNITMRDIISTPIFIRLGRRLRGPEGTEVGAIRHVNISDIVAVNAASRYACIISGIPGHDIQDVRIRNADLIFPGGGMEKQATTRPAEKEKSYPEPTMFGAMPAWGFYIRHVDGLELSDIDLSCLEPDVRPAFFLTEAKDVAVDHVRTSANGNAPLFALHNVANFDATRITGMADAHRDTAQDEVIGGGAVKPQP
jgi:polygalacturonase